VARRCWSCTRSIPRRKLSTLPAPGRRMRWSRRSHNWTSFSSPWARAWDGHEVDDLGTFTWQEIVALADVVLSAFWLETTLQERKSGRSPRARGAARAATWRTGNLEPWESARRGAGRVDAGPPLPGVPAWGALGRRPWPPPWPGGRASLAGAGM